MSKVVFLFSLQIIPTFKEWLFWSLYWRSGVRCILSTLNGQQYAASTMQSLGSHSAYNPQDLFFACLESRLWHKQLGRIWPKLYRCFLAKYSEEILSRYFQSPQPLWNLISVSSIQWGWSSLLGLYFSGPWFDNCHQAGSQEKPEIISCVSLLFSITALQCLKMGALCISFSKVLGNFAISYSIMARTGSRFYT